MEGDLNAPDWAHPAYDGWRGRGQAVLSRTASGLALDQALQAEAGAPVRFVPQAALPDGEAYEAFVFRTGQCPTRDNLHDFFNGLCWLRCPAAKKALNALQAAQIARHGVGGRRGPVRDAVTVFDENGALLQAPAPLWDALRQRDWRRLFADLRPLWQEARVLVFGHALLEKLAQPRKDLTAHVWDADAPLATDAGADAWLAARCTEAVLAGKPFVPLPVLGIPGWSPQNENFSFYDDSQVFRPRRDAALRENRPGP